MGVHFSKKSWTSGWMLEMSLVWHWVQGEYNCITSEKYMEVEMEMEMEEGIERW